MKNAVLMLYGHYSNENGISHPWQEDIFRQPQQLQAAFRGYGLDFHVGVAAHPPTSFRKNGDVPEIRVATNPIYDATGKLVEVHFKPGDLRDYSSVIDHWVANFQDPLMQPDGSRQRTAYGLGIPNDRVWNSRPIQEMGNRKDYMDALLRRHKVGIPSYKTSEATALQDVHGLMPIIYKPIDGSRGKGIEVYEDGTALSRALDDGRIAASGIIQPYFNLTKPIRGLVPASDTAAKQLREINSKEDRVREIRMHVITIPDKDGQLHTEAFPTLKYSHPGTPIMQVAGNIALDPSCVGPGHYIHDTSIDLAKAVCDDAAKRSGESVPQYYGVFDWMIDSDGTAYVGDGNCRGPALPVEAEAAREAFCRLLATSARRVFA